MEQFILFNKRLMLIWMLILTSSTITNISSKQTETQKKMHLEYLGENQGIKRIKDNREYYFQSFPKNFEYDLVRRILKDHKGYMWYATGNGLVRFDGRYLTVYEHKSDDSTSIYHNTVNAIVEDKNNNLWVSTAGGLNLYNRDLNHFYRFSENKELAGHLDNKFLTDLCIDDSSNLWIGTFGNGIHVFNTETNRIKNFPYEPDNPLSFSSNRIKCLLRDNQGNIWVGTQHGLNVFIPSRGRFYRIYASNNEDLTSNNNLSCNNISSLTVDAYNHIWVGTKGGGLNRVILNDTTIVVKQYPHLPGHNILSLQIDKNSYLWIGTENEGLVRLNLHTEKFRSFKVEEGNNFSLKSNSIWSLYLDDEDRLWIGTYNKGINVIDGLFNKFDIYQKNIVRRSSLPDNDVKAFAEDKKGRIWIATDGGGICVFNPNANNINRISYDSEKDQNLTNSSIQDIAIDERGNIWISAWGGGVDKLSSSGQKIRNYSVVSRNGDGDNSVVSLFIDSHQTVWACTGGSGLFYYHQSSDTFKQFVLSDASPFLAHDAYVAIISEDEEQQLWIGTAGGVVVLKRDVDNKYKYSGEISESTIPGLSSNAIDILFHDSEGRIWIGTHNSGVNLYNPELKTVTVYQEEDGLASNTIRGITEDKLGNIWITTSRGLSKFDNTEKAFTNFNRGDGLNADDFYVHACYTATDGRIYVGGENGFNAFYPTELKKNPCIPPVYIIGMKIDNMPVVPGDENSPLEKCLEETQRIELAYNQNSLSLEFIALNYTCTQNNQFKYMLEGFDVSWNISGSDQIARYTNIPPGKYVFSVMGSNNDGVWNDTPAQLAIIISKPFWKTWWACSLYALFIITGIFAIYRIWNERIRIINQLLLEKLATEKQQELNELNIQYFTNISHEFRTPLSLIFSPINNLVNTLHSDAKEQLLIIRKNAGRLLNLTNNLMNIRKMEEGALKLNVSKGDILQLAKKVSGFYKIRLKKNNIDFSIESHQTEIQGWFDYEKLETVLSNLLSNAVKYTSPHDRIRVEINCFRGEEIKNCLEQHNITYQPNSQYVEIKVIDSGVGIQMEELERIFDKFYQTKLTDKLKTEGTGLGLSLSKGLIEIHHGQIWAESIPGKETVFTIVLPIDKHVYTASEIVSETSDILEHEVLAMEEEFIEIQDSGLSGSNGLEVKSEILIVEDNDELRSFLVKELSKYFSVSHANNGESGFNSALESIPELVVSDIIMPKLNGINLCKSLKSDIRTCHIPVLLLTAKSSVHDQIKGAENGADAYLTKPFSIPLLVAKINQLISSRKKLIEQFNQELYPISSSVARSKLDQEFLQKIIDYIIQNISNSKLSVEELSSEFNLSHSNIFRKVKALTGSSIIELIKNIRLKHALKLIQENKYTLAEVAYRTGFTSPSYFTKCFKQKYGKSPSKYVQAHIS